MSDFYVYDNSQANYSCIHRRDCQHCNDGTGKLGHAVGLQDQFIAATNYAEAEMRAKALGRREWSSCKDCKPDHG